MQKELWIDSAACALCQPYHYPASPRDHVGIHAPLRHIFATRALRARAISPRAG